MDKDKEITIADLYPDLSPEQQAEAEYRLLRYFAVVKEIYDDLVASGDIEKVLLEIQWRKRFRNKK
jgi:hypothetical protein